MILLLDIGNTRLKWMHWDGVRLQPGGALSHREAELAGALATAWSVLAAPVRIVAASVADAGVRGAVDAWTQRRWQRAVEFVAPAPERAGVVNGYARPERLGVDRWVALLAAHQRFPGPACIVDCGSAVTIDALGRDGVHRGGLIVPGLGAQHRALTGGEIRLDAAAGLQELPQTLLASDTVQAVGYGIQYCLAAFIDRMCSRIDAELGEPCRRLLAGGDAERLRPLLDGDYQLVPHLVFEGLVVELGAQRGEGPA